MLFKFSHESNCCFSHFFIQCQCNSAGMKASGRSKHFFRKLSVNFISCQTPNIILSFAGGESRKSISPSVSRSYFLHSMSITSFHKIFQNPLGIIIQDTSEDDSFKITHGQAGIFSVIMRSPLPVIRLYHTPALQVLLIL